MYRGYCGAGTVHAHAMHGNRAQDVATGPETRTRPYAKNAAPPCAEGAAALGLCAPKPAGRTE